jgi:hypothetical protein
MLLDVGISHGDPLQDASLLIPSHGELKGSHIASAEPVQNV